MSKNTSEKEKGHERDKDKNERGENSSPDGKDIENILKTGTVSAGEGASCIHCISIVGQIEGHYILDQTQKATKYEQLLPLLFSIEESPDVKGLLVLLNTMGGDVEAGLAIAELIASMTKPTVSVVLGGGHSIGVPLAVCTDCSFIVPSATMTIHPVRTNGFVIGVPQSFYYFDKMQERILDFITSHSNADKETLRSLMMDTDELANDVGSIVDGKRAVDIGLIDRLGGLGDAVAKLKRLIGNA